MKNKALRILVVGLALTTTPIMIKSSWALESAKNKIRKTHCSVFLDNIKTNFEYGIEHLESNKTHLAYQRFGETLMRIRKEKKHIHDCSRQEDLKLTEIQEKSAHTLKEISERIFSS